MHDLFTLETELAKLPAAVQQQVREAARQLHQVLDELRTDQVKAAAIELTRAQLLDSISY